jgi:1,4-dihydroxy-2-naphthoyl-CoA hydrolase
VPYVRKVPEPSPAAPLTPSGLDAVFGAQYVEQTPDRVVIEWRVTPDQHQPFGLVHGGVFCSIVESAASIGATLWQGEPGRVVGVSNHTDFLRGVTEGLLTATATPIHRGRLQQLWLVEIVDEQQRLVARGQVRLQNLAVPAAR